MSTSRPTGPSGQHRRVLVDVTTFGADPSGATDATATDATVAVRAAVARARAVDGPVTLRFPTGRYAFWSASAERRELYVSNTVGADQRYRDKAIGLLLDGFTDVELDGCGSVFDYHGPQTTIAVIDTRLAVLHDFAVDMVTPTVVEVTVLEAGVSDGRAWRLLGVPMGTRWTVVGTEVVWLGEPDPLTGADTWTGRGAMDYTQVHDPSTDRTWRAPCPLFDDVLSIRSVPGGIVVEYRTSEILDDLGLVYQFRRTDRDHPGMLALDCGSVRLSDVRVGYLHGFGLLAQGGEDLTLDRVVFRAPEGSGRHTAGFADFVQCSGMRGTVEISDCVFDGAHDDAINVHGTYLRVESVTDDDTLVLGFAHPETAGFPQFASGERIEVIECATGAVVATGLVVGEVGGPSGRDHQHDLVRMTLRCQAPLPEQVRTALPGTLAVENTTRTPSLRVVGSTFTNLPTRGVLVGTRKPIRIEDNTFRGLGMAGVSISSDASEWWESGPVTDCVIAGNTFDDLGGPAVLIAPARYPVGGSHTVHHGIRVLGNHIAPRPGDDYPVVDATSVAGLVVAENVIDGATGSAPAFVRVTVCPDAVVIAGDAGSPVIAVADHLENGTPGPTPQD